MRGLSSTKQGNNLSMAISNGRELNLYCMKQTSRIVLNSVATLTTLSVAALVSAQSQRTNQATATQGPNSLLNPTLRDQNNDKIPDEWKWAPAPNGQSTLTRLIPTDGGNVVQITDNDKVVGVGMAQSRPVRANQSYEFTAQVQGDPIFLYIKFYDAKGGLIEPEHRISASGGTQWKTFSIRRNAPPNAVSGEAWFYTTSVGTGEVRVRQPQWQEKPWMEPIKGPITSDSAYFEALNLDFPGMEAVKQAVARNDYNAAKAAYLQFRRTRSGAKWNIDPAQKPAKPEATTDAAGDKVLAHQYAFPYDRNAPTVQLPPNINWEFNPTPPTDPSFTKEWTWITMNRMHQWDTLGTAYWKTGDEKYAREWVAQLQDWVQDNPLPLEASPGETLTWRSIEGGIRMAGSWPNSYFRFLHSPSFSPEAHLDYAKSVWEHALRLERVQREYPNHGGNWVTMECNGLGTAAVLFPEWKQSNTFLRTAFERMNKELSAQVYPDGAQHELAPGYHQVSLNNFMALAKTAKLNNALVPGDYLSQLKAMYLFNARLMDQSGILPPLHDSGPVNVVPLLKEARTLWNDNEFVFGSTLGKEGTPLPASNVFPYAGYAVMRGGWNPTDSYMVFDAGPVGTGHWHEDKLTLYLRAFGQTLLTEGGNYMYDKSKWRRYILGTTAHNTITVDGKEQRRADQKEPITQPLNNPWLSTPQFDYAAGTYDSGYQATEYAAREYMPVNYIGAKDNSVAHTRHVVFLKPHYYVVVDFLHSPNGDTKSHRYDAYFHLDAPEASINDANKSVRTQRADKVQLSLIPLDTNGLEVRKVIGQEEPVLGWIPTSKRKIPTIVYTKNGAAPQTFSTLLYPYQSSANETAPQVLWKDMPNLPAGVWAKEIETPHEKVVVAIKQATTNQAIDVTLNGTKHTLNNTTPCVVIRTPKQ
jgi:hypothetical protein